MSGVIFGGKFLVEIDIACAMLCRQCLYQSETCSEIYTHKLEHIEFVAPARLGDIVVIETEITDLKKKAIVIDFEAYAERNGTGLRERVAFGSLVFVTHEKGKLQYHGLSLD